MSVLHETVYEDRFVYVPALKAMGGEIELFSTCLGGPACRFHDTSYLHSAVVRGVSKLHGAEVDIPDVRGGVLQRDRGGIGRRLVTAPGRAPPGAGLPPPGGAAPSPRPVASHDLTGASRPELRPVGSHVMGVSERIMEHAERLTATERRIAEVIASEPQTIAFGTVALVAKQAGTSGPSVVRLAVKLGYGGFVELQADVQRDVARMIGPARERIRPAAAERPARTGGGRRAGQRGEDAQRDPARRPRAGGGPAHRPEPPGMGALR